MEIVYDKSTGTWSERQEPYTTLDVQTEENWNKLEFMINNFSKLEEENDTLKTELMAVKSGSDVLKICKLEEKNAELKRLLKLAVEDIKTALPYMTKNCEIICAEGEQSCDCITTAQCECTCNWKHAEEALKLIGDDNND